MTLKEAYEVFFGNTNERITSKFIIENISVNEFKNRYRNLLRKWHPDMNPNNQNMAHEMTVKINEAYVILNNVYKEEKNKTKQKETARKQKNMSPEERQSLENKYRRIFLKAANIYKYKLFMKFIEDTEKYYELTSFISDKQMNLVDIYKNINIYGNIVSNFNKQINILDDKYNEAKKKLKLADIDEISLNKLYLDIIGPYENIMSDSVKYAEILNWYENRNDMVAVEIENKASAINNIESKIIQRIKQIKNNFKNICNLKKCNMVNDVYGALYDKRNSISNEDMLRVSTNYVNYIKYLDSLDDEFQQKCMMYLDLIKSNKSLKIDLDFLAMLEKDLNGVLKATPEEIKVLFENGNDFDKLLQKVSFESKNKKVKNIYTQSRTYYINEINRTIEYLHKLKKMVAREESKLEFTIPDGKVGKNMSSDELISYYDKIKSLKSQGMYKVIETIYEYLICYYANNTEYKTIPMEITAIIDKLKNGKPEERNFDLSECLYKLEQVYQEKIGEYNLRPRDKIKDAARLALTNKIYRIEKELKQNNFLIPLGIKNDILKIKDLDIISLYEFADRIEEYLYSQMFVEFKVK